MQTCWKSEMFGRSPQLPAPIAEYELWLCQAVHRRMAIGYWQVAA